jgi:outer membrane receptor protein involved in Fe transport
VFQFGLVDSSGSGTGKQVLQRKPEILPGSPAVRAYWPVQGASYAQDDMEWEGLRFRAGIRFDYFDARSTLPSNLANPANSIAGSIPSVPVRTSAKYSFSPRIGVSYPVTSGTSIYFAYGHFTQMPQLSDIFNNADYSVLKDLQARISYDVMGNPDVKPERTVQYQFGVKHAVNANLGLDLNAFYKDIRDLLGTEFIATDNDAEYPRITNVDFGSVIGATLSVDARQVGPFGISADYTWQMVQGDASDPRETANRAQLGLDALPHQIPLDWDQRHTLNLTTSYTHVDGTTAAAILRVASGQPYTPTTGLGGFGSTLETNSGRKPLSWVMDVRGEAPVRLWGLPLRAFARVFNVFDTRFFNGFVFASSGNVDYSSTPVGDAGGLLDPARFYQPRRIEVGFTARGGGGS